MKFLNKKCGVIEYVENKELIKMYKAHSDVYEEIKGKKSKKDNTSNDAE